MAIHFGRTLEKVWRGSTRGGGAGKSAWLVLTGCDQKSNFLEGLENKYFLALNASFGTTDTTGNCPEVSVKSRYFTLLVQRFETQPRTALVAQLALPSCL